MAVQCKNMGEDDKAVDVNLENSENIENKAGGKRRRIQYKKHLLLFGSLLIMLLVVIVIWMIVLLVKYDAPKNYSTTLETSSMASSTTTLNSDSITDSKLKIVSRSEWVAEPPTGQASPLKLPVPYVIISHTATENCSDQAACTLHTRYIQSFHIISRNWYDIGYNFLVGGDGLVYEGRGWAREGAHTYDFNSKSLGIAFIGTFNSYVPPQKQIDAAKGLIQKGVELGYIAPDYKVLASRQVQTTQSPGQSLYEEIKTWPHWSEKP